MNRAASVGLALISVATPAGAERCVVIHQGHGAQRYAGRVRSRHQGPVLPSPTTGGLWCALVTSISFTSGEDEFCLTRCCWQFSMGKEMTG